MEKINYTLENLFSHKKSELLNLLEVELDVDIPKHEDVLVKKTIVDDEFSKIVIHFGMIKIIITKESITYVDNKDFNKNFTYELLV